MLAPEAHGVINRNVFFMLETQQMTSHDVLE